MIECEECEGNGYLEEYCGNCNGSGEGMHDGSTCYQCHGSGGSQTNCTVCEGSGEVVSLEERYEELKEATEDLLSFIRKAQLQSLLDVTAEELTAYALKVKLNKLDNLIGE